MNIFSPIRVTSLALMMRFKYHSPKVAGRYSQSICGLWCRNQRWGGGGGGTRSTNQRAPEERGIDMLILVNCIDPGDLS